MEAVVNKLGGMKGLERFLQDEINIQALKFLGKVTIPQVQKSS